MDDPRGHVVVVGDDSVRVRVPEELAARGGARSRLFPADKRRVWGLVDTGGVVADEPSPRSRGALDLSTPSVRVAG